MKEEMRRMRTIKDEMKEEMQQQLQSIRLEFEERCAKQHQSQQNEIRSQLSKHEDEVRRAVGEQLLAQRVTSSNAVSNGEISALQSNISDLSERVDQLIGQFTQHTEETVSLRTSVEECSKKVNDQAQVVNGLETKFSDLDLQDLIGLADMSLRFPPLERQLQGVQPQMKALSDKVQQMVSRMVTLTGGMVDQLRHTVDEIQKTIADQGGRIRALEDVSPSSSRLGAMGGFATGESTNADVVSIKGDFDSTKAEVERLTQEYSRLSEQVNRVKKDVASAQSVNGELESVRHQILVLDSQFGNLSTKALAEHIIGHLEQVMVYPNARQLAADFDSLKTLVDHLVSRIDSLEGKGEGSTSSVNGRFLVGHNELCGNGIGQKRKRADFELNGAEHPATNGAG
jgi:DNA repair exonuclease SbcCD ATPase subunit